MPSPVTPAQIKETVNDVGAPLCGKFFNMLRRLPELFYQIILYERNEDGTLSDEFKDDVCALGCTGGDGSSPGSTLAAPTGVSATDGSLGDRIRVTWNAVLGATEYEIWRSASNVSGGALLLGTSTTTDFDDTTAAVDTIYYYWVKARNTTQTSAFSAPDTGYISTELDAVADLSATQGFFRGTGGASYVILVWTPVTGATAYDIYRNTTNSFGGATKIDSDRSPFDNSESLSSGPSPLFVDNGGELVYYHEPISNFVQYYFWVVPKRTTPTPAEGLASNSADGWAIGFGDGTAPRSDSTFMDSSSPGPLTVPSGVTRAWVVMWGSSGGGAGGNAAVGGGGGGGGAVCWGELAVAAGGSIRLVFTPDADTGNAANSTNGGAGTLTQVDYQPPAGAFANVLQSTAPGGGVFAAAGDGAGGAGGVGSAAGMVTSVTKNGRSGKSAAGNKGGRGGATFGSIRSPGAHFILSYAGNSPNGGGGSYSVPSSAVLATGGNGLRGRCIVMYHQ